MLGRPAAFSDRGVALGSDFGGDLVVEEVRVTDPRIEKMNACLRPLLRATARIPPTSMPRRGPGLSDLPGLARPRLNLPKAVGLIAAVLHQLSSSPGLRDHGTAYGRLDGS
jgi:hypothetical protein